MNLLRCLKPNSPRKEKTNGKQIARGSARKQEGERPHGKKDRGNRPQSEDGSDAGIGRTETARRRRVRWANNDRGSVGAKIQHKERGCRERRKNTEEVWAEGAR